MTDPEKNLKIFLNKEDEKRVPQNSHENIKKR